MRDTTRSDQSFLSILLEAITGKEQDFTTGSINRAIVLLSIPMVLEMAMESLFAVFDVLFVSMLNDNDAVATVGLTESVLTLVYSLAMGVSMGATAMVARRIGEKNADAANAAAMQAIYIGIGMAALIGTIGTVFAGDILRLLGAGESLIASGVGYTHWMFAGNLSIMMLFLINGIFRGAGNAALAMRALWLANGLNIILDPLFIHGIGPFEGFGVEGAAIATNIGRTAGVIYQVYHLWRGKGAIHLKYANKAIDWSLIGRLLKLAAGGTGQFIIASASWIILMSIMAKFGSAALAGYTIAIRIIVFTILPAWGMANAAATLVGQNLGAGQPERAETSVWRAAFYNMVFLGGISLVFLLGAEPILKIFSDDPEVLRYGSQCLRIVALGYIFFAYGMVISQAFNGAGDTRTPTILNFFGFWVFQVPLAYGLALHADLGPTGVYVAVAIAESLLAMACILVFRRGKWKTVKV